MKYADAWEDLTIQLQEKERILDAAVGNLDFGSQSRMIAKTEKQTVGAVLSLMQDLEVEFE